jgi:hypothetical protein
LSCVVAMGIAIIIGLVVVISPDYHSMWILCRYKFYFAIFTPLMLSKYVLVWASKFKFLQSLFLEFIWYIHLSLHTRSKWIMMQWYLWTPKKILKRSWHVAFVVAVPT